MASIVLSTAGAAVGQNFGGPVGAYIGSRIGQTIGSAIDRNIFGGKNQSRSRGARLTDLGVQSSTYGKMIPLVYGACRVGGNIIWSRPIRETATTTTSSGGVGGKGGGGRVSQSTTTYSYSVSLAVSVCEGPVDGVLRIWADAKPLDLSTLQLRIYRGDEDQLPDSLISGFEGAARTPAYRGQCYVVFEDFQLAEFGNRIPNFTFEVKRKLIQPDYAGETLESMIKGMVMIPGAGEFVYDTEVQQKIPGLSSGSGWVQQGSQQVINMHNPSGKANSVLSLDQLEETCPNVQWVSLVVAWFGDSLDAASCVIKPGVEYQNGATTSPDSWQVAGYTRSSARLITQLAGSPQYGGTPDDDSLIRYATELRARGYKILFYPLIFMDTTGKPWRGELTGSAADVSSFFTKTEGYNDFILHYASLMAPYVDAFSIGSEMKGLTKVTNTPGVYPAVSQLATLAANVKSIVGTEVKVTYAADWSEYHSTIGGWYHMDPLWASSSIDFIGIDAYFPLTDSPSSVYDVDAIKAGWVSGEGYDWFYSDTARTIQTPLAPAYAWKNLSWFWNNPHVNPGGASTPWVPQSKTIWFTEYGFPSVDCATNQPNVFYDPTSVSSALPYFSRGRIDFRAQRAGLIATEQQWKNSAMVERLFVWTWDARPYPYWPDLKTIWSDGDAWKTGHWVQGKLGISSLGAIIKDLCLRIGLAAENLKLDKISDQVEGFVITSQQSVRDAVEALAQAYFFDAVESDGLLQFVPRGAASQLSLTESDLLQASEGGVEARFRITRAQEVELPRRVNVVYLSRIASYQTQTQYSQREMSGSREVVTLDLPVVLSDQLARNIADARLYTAWVARVGYEFMLSTRHCLLDPGDVMTVTVAGVSHRMRLIYTRLQADGKVLVRATADDVTAYDFYSVPGLSNEPASPTSDVSATSLALLDTAALPGDEVDKAIIRAAGAGLSEPWSGAALYRSDDAGASFSRVGDIAAAAVIGTALDALATGTAQVFDAVSTVTVSLIGQGALQSVSEIAVLNGANLALLGDELFQFRSATLLEPGKYRLSGLLRGRLGTEWAIAGHSAGERFVLLDARVTRLTAPTALIGLARDFKAVTFGGSLTAAPSTSFTYRGAALRPYSPVHVSASRDASGTITLRWVRRARQGGVWQDNVDVPLNEASERYDVEVMNGASIARSWTALTAPMVIYSAAEQVADFGSLPSSVEVRIYQISEIVGRGYAANAVV
ncbi:MAG: glycoside hydrolase TIM-barrel-like domain-containing protein [Alphaproteobacteria bacterium]|nr:glycoside hydrolase TIM-barrel-like domain-containing protein [Alphaproteobacteria bacterium]